MEVSSVTGHLSEVFVLALCEGPGIGARLPTKVSFFQSVFFLQAVCHCSTLDWVLIVSLL